MNQDKVKDVSETKFKIYTVPGDPVALARTRISSQTRVWDSQKQLKLVCGIQIQNQHETLPLFTGPLAFNVTFFMGIAPTSRNKNLSGSYHYFRPDLDNLIKFICDVATGILYHEDCLISSITAKKVYDPNPRTEFFITELTGMPYVKPKGIMRGSKK